MRSPSVAIPISCYFSLHPFIVHATAAHACTSFLHMHVARPLDYSVGYGVSIYMKLQNILAMEHSSMVTQLPRNIRGILFLLLTVKGKSMKDHRPMNGKLVGVSAKPHTH